MSNEKRAREWADAFKAWAETTPAVEDDEHALQLIADRVKPALDDAEARGRAEERARAERYKAALEKITSWSALTNDWAKNIASEALKAT